MSKTLFFTLLALLFLSSTVSAGIIRDRRAIEDYWYSNGVVNNMGSDTLAGGPSTLGWAQAPHLYSPMFSI